MIIDFHTHVFPESLAPRAIEHMKDLTGVLKNYTDGTLTGLKKSMYESGIDRSVTLPVATKPSQVPGINDISIERNGGDVLFFGAMHPKYECFEQELDKLHRAGIKGIKLHPEYQHFHVDSKALYPLYEVLAHRKMVCLFHAGREMGPFPGDRSGPAALKKVSADFPRLKMVAAHLGGFLQWDRVAKELAGAAMYFDTAAILEFISPEQCAAIINKHGADKVLFGTDSPWFSQKESIAWIQNLPLSANQKDAILGKNATELLQ